MYAACPSPFHFCKPASRISIFEGSKCVVICWCESHSLRWVSEKLGFHFSHFSALAVPERVQEYSWCEETHFVSNCVRLVHKFCDIPSWRSRSIRRPKQVYNFPATYVTETRLFSSSRALTRSTRPSFLKWSDSPSDLYVQRLSCRFGIFPSFPSHNRVLYVHFIQSSLFDMAIKATNTYKHLRVPYILS
jgi:hypothetical protein